MEIYTIALLILAFLTVALCTGVSQRLGWAAIGVGGGFGVMIAAQLGMRWEMPSLALLAALVDIAALVWIGKAVAGRTWPSGVHVAGLAMCASLVAHPIYYLMGNAESLTFTYYLATNACMVIACLGLMGSAWAELVGRHGPADLPHALSGRRDRAAGLASRREAS